MTHQTPTRPACRATTTGPAEADPHRAGPYTQRLPTLPSSAGVTRRHLELLLRSWQLDAYTDTAQLAASELVANAVTAAEAMDSGLFPERPRPGPQSIELGVRRTEMSVIIEVRDPNPNPPVVQQADPADEGGRGLFLVEILCTSWGYSATKRGGKVVWCEIALTDAGRRAPRRS